MSKTPDEVVTEYRKLESIATYCGVTPLTLAQYVDQAGSYSNMTTRESGVPRRLPIRTSMDGVMLASRISTAIGTSKARTVVVRYTKLQRRQNGSPADSNSSTGTGAEGWPRETA